MKTILTEVNKLVGGYSRPSKQRSAKLSKLSKPAFTLIELMVVMAMIAIIAASMTTAVAQAQRRAKISRAETEARELTNAILAWQNYDENGSLSKYMMEDAVAAESKMGFVLGRESGRAGKQVPVLFNATIAGGNLVDPWGHPYRVTVKLGDPVNPLGVPNMNVRVFYPNWHRVR